jgi:hypothetical protein
MHISIPKATTNRNIGERELMARGERAVPLAGRRDGEPGAAPGAGEGNEGEGGNAAEQLLNDWGGAYEGGIVAETPGVCELRGVGEESIAVAYEVLEGGPLQVGLRQLFPSTEVLEGFGREQAHDGGVAGAAALDAFETGPCPPNWRIDRIRFRDYATKTRGCVGI